MSKKNDTDNHIEIEKRKSMLTDCVLCPRNCHADRINGRWGRCHETAEIVVARAALHMWEEPCISGDAGSGAERKRLSDDLYCKRQLPCILQQRIYSVGS